MLPSIEQLRESSKPNTGWNPRFSSLQKQEQMVWKLREAAPACRPIYTLHFASQYKYGNIIIDLCSCRVSCTFYFTSGVQP